MYPHREFHELDLSSGWLAVEGYPPGVWYKELAGSLEADRVRVRLVRFDAGAFTTEPVTHDTAEMVLIFTGDLQVGGDAQGRGGREFRAPTFAIRPSDVAHGPFASREGCIMLEFHAAV